MLPNREGTFNACPMDIGVDETGPNHLATCIIAFRLYEELQESGEWADCTPENLEITGYFYLEKKDGSPNNVAVDALKAAFGWDGRDPFWLQDNVQALAEKPVQLKLGAEEYDGRTRIKVKFLNPHGSTAGGVPRGDDNARQSILTRLGPRLRALAGGTPANAPKPSPRPSQPAAAAPKARPQAPAAPKSKPPAPKSPAAPAAPKAPSAPPPSPAEKPDPPMPSECSMEDAWAVFCQAYETKGPKEKSDDDCQKQWFAAITALLPGRDVGSLTAAEWAMVRDKAPSEIVPF